MDTAGVEMNVTLTVKAPTSHESIFTCQVVSSLSLRELPEEVVPARPGPAIPVEAARGLASVVILYSSALN